MSTGLSLFFSSTELKEVRAYGAERGKKACGKFKEAFRERNEMDQEQPVPGQVQIKADEKELQGQYSNLVMIHHNLEEFTMNFIYIFPNGAQGKLLTSMILSPGHAKRIWRALGENLARYEAQFGNIKESPEGSTPAPNVGFVQ
jgi:Protein of unknown function (DUF3467)